MLVCQNRALSLSLLCVCKWPCFTHVARQITCLRTGAAAGTAERIRSPIPLQQAGQAAPLPTPQCCSTYRTVSYFSSSILTVKCSVFPSWLLPRVRTPGLAQMSIMHLFWWLRQVLLAYNVFCDNKVQ